MSKRTKRNVLVTGNGRQFYISQEDADARIRKGTYAWCGTDRRPRIKYIGEAGCRIRDFSARHGEYVTVHRRESWAKAFVSDVRRSVERARSGK